MTLIIECCPECSDADKQEQEHQYQSAEIYESHCPYCQRLFVNQASFETHACVQNEAVLNDIDTVIESLVSAFEAEWERAPQAMRRYCEQAIACYWYERGQQAQRTTQTEDLNEMNRLMRERNL